MMVDGPKSVKCLLWEIVYSCFNTIDRLQKYVLDSKSHHHGGGASAKRVKKTQNHVFFECPFVAKIWAIVFFSFATLLDTISWVRSLFIDHPFKETKRKLWDSIT